MRKGLYGNRKRKRHNSGNAGYPFLDIPDITAIHRWRDVRQHRNRLCAQS